jgi:hypothetical protein
MMFQVHLAIVAVSDAADEELELLFVRGRSHDEDCPFSQ